jgi:hypothetical protein
MAVQEQAPRRAARDWSFLAKLIGAAVLATIAQGLFLFQRGGTTIGGFALLLLIVAAALAPAMRRNRASRAALAAAAFFALVLAADPGPLALALYWTMLTLAALLTRANGFDDGWRWTLRLARHGLVAGFLPIRDLLLFNRARRRGDAGGIGRLALILVLPALGSLLFLVLFTAANPLIQDFFQRFDASVSPQTIVRAFFWGIMAVAIWSVLRPARLRTEPASPWAGHPRVFDIGAASLIVSLAAFNLIFALQNGLDIAFLWSGARLPGEMTLAEYAHRGAYPLIATALLAGLFVLVALRPGSATALRRPVRVLVTLWIAQNLLLVASTMLRMFDYIESYSLTELRIAALVWMALVAIGLALICYRLLRGRSGAWLINANMLAALIVLAGATCVDFGRTAAAWNVRHAREVGGRGVELDLCYLNGLGASALLPLLELETRQHLPAELRDRVRWLRAQALARLAETQADWHGWTPRGALRLAAAQAIVAEHNLSPPRPLNRQCDGREYVAPPPPPPSMPEEMPPAPQVNVSLPEENGMAAPLTANAAR